MHWKWHPLLQTLDDCIRNVILVKLQQGLHEARIGQHTLGCVPVWLLLLEDAHSLHESKAASQRTAPADI